MGDANITINLGQQALNMPPRCADERRLGRICEALAWEHRTVAVSLDPAGWYTLRAGGMLGDSKVFLLSPDGDLLDDTGRIVMEGP